jgi:two-component system OmpR family sensor kinase
VLGRLPIRLRLTLAFTVAMAGLLAAMSFFVVLRVDRALTSSLDREMTLQARELGPRAGRQDSLLDPDATGSVSVAQLLSSNGAVVEATRAGLGALLGRADVQSVLAGATIRRDARLAGLGGEWRLLGFPVLVDGQPAVGAIAASLVKRNEARDHLLRELLIIGPLALAIASLGGYLLAASALRPVEEMRRRAAAISADTVGVRLPVPVARDEISRLATTLNATLDRLDDALARERRFVADASHELRTPLALMRTELELALRRRRSPEELEAAIRSASEETDRLSRIAEDLLLIARSDAGELPLRRENVHVAEIIESVVQRYGRQAADAARRIETECNPRLAVAADPLRLEQALGNLVDNAIQHGAGEIVIACRPENGSVRLSVSDGGPGFPEPFAERAFERFSRADEARGRGGSGLGLAIVDLIARSHGGAAGVERSESGGAEVWLTIPVSGHEPAEA